MEEKKDLLIPKNDLVFHTLFRAENKRLTEALISDILRERVKIKTTDKDRYLNIKDPDQKYGIMDLRTELEDGTNCNIEVQVTEYDYENERFLYYWADAYSRQLEKGNDYNTLHKTISIIILDHEIEELQGVEKLGTKWQIRDNESGKRLLTEHLELVIIEIPKALRLYEKNGEDRICQWMLFLNDPNEREVSKIMDENDDIKQAIKELEEISGDDDLRRMAELRLKAIRDEHAALSLATKRGLEEGRKKGLQEGIEQGIEQATEKTVRNMLKENLDIDVIKKITGLSKEKIEEIKNRTSE